MAAKISEVKVEGQKMNLLVQLDMGTLIFNQAEWAIFIFDHQI